MEGWEGMDFSDGRRFSTAGSYYLSPVESPLWVLILEVEGGIARLHALHLAPQSIHLHPNTVYCSINRFRGPLSEFI